MVYTRDIFNSDDVFHGHKGSCFTKGLYSITVILLYIMEQPLIAFRGNRDEWLDFTHAVRKNKTTVWAVLAPVLQKYAKQSTKS